MSVISPFFCFITILLRIILSIFENKKNIQKFLFANLIDLDSFRIGFLH